eukprot:TRINITY_DN779_c0_g2_i1.p1 TRINITY_DN779_c0_g2~~TRINITY_DN779_c0_g2_i1.p1  ORF type:complete len:536 (+),score=172.47 TRINITY_DN779_c0_g2_i1:158-1609(+)
MGLATRMTIENYYRELFKSAQDRHDRLATLQRRLDELKVDQATRERYLEQLRALETNYIRARRYRLTGTSFEPIKIIGRGAFGEVRLVQMKKTKHLYAMKILSKQKMVEKRQTIHVKAERDVLAAANAVYQQNPWIVKLYYSFQDSRYLYLIMEFLPGGDLMTQLIKYVKFAEDDVRFYVAETVIAIDSIHALGYAHRDIKPDNLLLDKEGHMKLSDFGLCTTLSSIADLRESIGGRGSGGSGWRTQAEKFESWQKQRRELAYSNVGTPDYTAPEVLQGKGYGKECDWWSAGIIMFEMLVGYPPFCSETQEETYHKIINFRETLPPVMQECCTDVSAAAQDLIMRLLSFHKARIGTEGGMQQIFAHPFFHGFDWRSIRKIRPPIKPPVTSPTDCGNFDDFGEIRNVVGGLLQDDDWSDPNARCKKFQPHDIPFIGYTYRSFDAFRRATNTPTTATAAAQQRAQPQQRMQQPPPTAAPASDHRH